MSYRLFSFIDDRLFVDYNSCVMVQTKIKNMNKSKRKRTENWSARDKSLLRELCAERIHIIENKCVDTDTNRLKRECWNQITDKFNSISETKRDVARIQFQWRNMKMKAKTAESAYRKALNKTGDGPPPQSPTKEGQELMELISSEFKINKNEFESDEAALQIKDEHISEDTSDNFADDYKDNEFEKDYLTEYNQSQDSVGVNHSHLQSLPTKKLKKKKIVHDSEALQKRELFELTKANIMEEHEMRMSILRLEKQCRKKELEKFELEMELLRK